MIRQQSIDAFDIAMGLAEVGSRSPEAAAKHIAKVYELLRTLRNDIHGAELPDRVVVPEILRPVTLSTVGATTTPEIDISWPSNGFLIGIGCEVPEGHRERISFELTVNGNNPLITKGKSGAGYAPIKVLQGSSTDGGTPYRRVWWRINSNDVWRIRFTSLGAPLPAGSPDLVLTPQPFFLFVQE